MVFPILVAFKLVTSSNFANLFDSSVGSVPEVKYSVLIKASGVY